MIDPISARQAAPAAVVTARQQSVAAPVEAETAPQGDTVTLSAPGRLLASLSSLHFFGSDENGNLSRESVAKAAEELQSDVAVMFAQAGVRDDPPVELTMDAMGKVRVKGDHPDKATIEALFEKNPDLRNRFAGISAATSLLDAMEEHMEFVRAYEQDPQAAVQRFWYLFEDTDIQTSEPFSMTVTG